MKHAEGEPADIRLKIIDAAVRCFERYGPQRTSMNDIADEAGISRRTLYRIFGDRSDLIETLLHRRLAEMGRRVEEHLASRRRLLLSSRKRSRGV